MAGQGRAVWFVGLPVSGKSAVARTVAERLGARGVPVHLLQMDERRKVYFPEPTYSRAERESAYRMFAEEAHALVNEGRVVFMDATAPSLSMRQAAREMIPKFAEVYIRCTIETAMKREASRPGGQVMADLYAKALERKRTGRQFEGLGEVPGVDAPFEENPNAELILDNEAVTLEQARDRVLEFLEGWMAEDKH